MIMIMHRLKRLIGSFYHQKRIDIIITDNAHYVRNGAYDRVFFNTAERNRLMFQLPHATVPDIMGIIV